LLSVYFFSPLRPVCEGPVSMGNSQRRLTGTGTHFPHRRERDRGARPDRPSGGGTDTGTGGARQRSSSQPTRNGQRSSNRPSGATGGHGTRQTAPQWVTTQSYTPSIAAEITESKSIKNHANLNKPSLQLIPARDGRFRIRFRADCRLETEVSIYLATRETPNEGHAGVRFEPQHPRFANAVLPMHKLPAESDCTYTSPSINVRNYWKYLKYRPHQPHDYPIVIAMTYTIPDAEWEALKAPKEGEPKEKEEEEGAEPKPPVPEARPIQSQFTYAEVVRSLVDDKPADYGIKVLKQRLQVGNDLYDLEDIYGLPADAAPSGAGEHTGGEPIEGSLAGLSAGHDEGEDCVICLAEPRNTLVMPCRHMCLCTECAAMLRQRTNKCPICRTVAERFVTFKKNAHGEEPKVDSDSDGEVDFGAVPTDASVSQVGNSRVRSVSASPSHRPSPPPGHVPPAAASIPDAGRRPSRSGAPANPAHPVAPRASRPIERY
jgi:hypothetical protein